MTSEAQVLLAVLAPVGGAILLLATKLLDRHLKMIDETITTLKAIEKGIQATAQLQERQAERLDRIEDGLLARLERVEEAIGLSGKIDEIHRQVSSPDLAREPTGRHTPLAPERAEKVLPGGYSQINPRTPASSRGPR